MRCCVFSQYRLFFVISRKIAHWHWWIFLVRGLGKWYFWLCNHQYIVCNRSGEFYENRWFLAIFCDSGLRLCMQTVCKLLTSILFKLFAWLHIYKDGQMFEYITNSCPVTLVNIIGTGTVGTKISPVQTFSHRMQTFWWVLWKSVTLGKNSWWR